MLFRRASPADVPAMLSVSEAAGVVYRPRAGVLLVADAGGVVVGWLEGVVDGAYTGPGVPVVPPHGYVQAVVVDPSARRRGVGTGLLEAFVGEARTAGVRWVFAFPDEDQGVQERVAWLAAAGFSPVDDPDEEWPAMGRWT